MKTNLHKLHKESGFTLIELLLALGISGVLLTAVYSSFQSQQKSYTTQEQVVEVQQNIRAAIAIMTQEIRMAGYDPYHSATAGITTAAAQTIAFTMVADDDGIDNDNFDGDNNSATGADETGELKTISYDLYDAYTDGDTDIGRQVGSSAATKRAIAENIDQLEFRYLDKNSNETTVLNNIRTVQISILARADKPDRSFTNSQTYTTPSGATWGPYNDNFRRRFQILTIHCRNLEY